MQTANTLSERELRMAGEAPAANMKLSYALMGGHLCTDINQGALSAALPFLMLHNGFSYTEVLLVILGSTIVSAVVQPLFGWLGDKRACPWFMALGVFLAGLGMFGTGLFTQLGAIIASAVVSGIGIAMFHPEGGRLGNLVAGVRKEHGMSVFAVGGNVGFATGPVLVAIFLGTFGMAGTAVFLVPSTLYALFLLSLNKRFKAYGIVDVKAVAASHGHDRWGAFGMLLGLLSIRSIIFYGCMAFLPLFAVGVLGQGESAGSLMITAYSLTGVVATFSSGLVSERIGTTRLMCVSLVVVTLLLLGFSASKYLPLSIILVMLLALSMNLPYPSTVALGQRFLPNHLGMASGLAYGVGTCVGGIAEPGLGTVGDMFGLVPVFWLLALSAFASLLIAIVIARLVRRYASEQGD